MTVMETLRKELRIVHLKVIHYFYINALSSNLNFQIKSQECTFSNCLGELFSTFK